LSLKTKVGRKTSVSTHCLGFESFLLAVRSQQLSLINRNNRV